MYKLIKSFLFLFDPEQVHHFTTMVFGVLSGTPLIKQLLSAYYHYEKPQIEQTLLGLHFKNPVGLAAGFDKNGEYIEQMCLLGFGFIELGTVTPRPQGGNDKPRLFRLVKDRAIINRMGFNNKGVDFLVHQLKKRKKTDVIIGGNIGKNKDTPNEEAAKDYLICFKKLYPYVDYFVVNLSSPNTPGLRSLQEKKPLRKILKTLIDYRSKQDKVKPILLKIAPDLTQYQIKDVVEIAEELNIDGIIATNTTIQRDQLKTPQEEIDKIGAGGLSGLPLQKLSTDILVQIKQVQNTNMPLIGVGGIDSGLAAEKKMQSGASLIQVYTGLIYKGPMLAKKIKKHLAKSRKLA